MWLVVILLVTTVVMYRGLTYTTRKRAIGQLCKMRQMHVITFMQPWRIISFMRPAAVYLAALGAPLHLR